MDTNSPTCATRLYYSIHYSRVLSRRSDYRSNRAQRTSDHVKNNIEIPAHRPAWFSRQIHSGVHVTFVKQLVTHVKLKTIFIIYLFRISPGLHSGIIQGILEKVGVYFRPLGLVPGHQCIVFPKESRFMLHN